MKKASEHTIIKVLVNLKCLGYPGKVLKSFTHKERGRVLDELITRGWVNNNLIPTAAAQDVILKNLSLCES